jgi:hypothetical protein
MIGPVPSRLLVAATALVQGPDLGSLASKARQAFASHEFASLLRDSPSVRLRLPDGSLGVVVRGLIAAAALETFTRRQEELEIAIQGAAPVEPRQGYVELRRRFRSAGVADEQVQRVLLSVRLVEDRWQIVEIWVVEAGPRH